MERERAKREKGKESKEKERKGKKGKGKSFFQVLVLSMRREQKRER